MGMATVMRDFRQLESSDHSTAKNRSQPIIDGRNENPCSSANCFQPSKGSLDGRHVCDCVQGCFLRRHSLMSMVYSFFFSMSICLDVNRSLHHCKSICSWAVVQNPFFS